MPKKVVKVVHRPSVLWPMLSLSRLLTQAAAKCLSEWERGSILADEVEGHYKGAVKE